MRLGKIEKYILTWAARFHDSHVRYLSKSGALLSYARHELGRRVAMRPASVKSVLEPAEYNRLHVSFSRALRRLAEGELIKLVSRGNLLAQNDLSAYGLFWGARRDTFYSLTNRGRLLALRLLRE